MRSIATLSAVAIVLGMLTVMQAFLMMGAVAMVHIGILNVFLNRPGGP
jgi:hypothetical protein